MSLQTELNSSWESEEVLLNALAAINNLTYYATGDGLWSQQAERLGEGEWKRMGWGEVDGREG